MNDNEEKHYTTSGEDDLNKYLPAEEKGNKNPVIIIFIICAAIMAISTISFIIIRTTIFNKIANEGKNIMNTIVDQIDNEAKEQITEAQKAIEEAKDNIQSQIDEIDTELEEKEETPTTPQEKTPSEFDKEYEDINKQIEETQRKVEQAQQEFYDNLSEEDKAWFEQAQKDLEEKMKNR